MSGPRILAVSLEQFFHDMLREVAQRQRIELTDLAFVYILNLLVEFSSPKKLRGVNSKNPILAELLQHAQAAQLNTEKLALLKQLGDFALFVSGFFPDSIERRLVDVRYYIAMGENAYSAIASFFNSGQKEGIEELYRDLADRFGAFVDLISEISEETRVRSDDSLLSLYERYLKTRSERLQKKLMEHGMPIVF